MHLRNRVMVPPHGSAIGDLWGTEEQAARHIAYWEERAKDGASWIDGVRGRVRNPVIPGFEPHGYGAETRGNYRSPNYVERVQGMVAALHRAGAVVTSQLTVIGGVPQAPSPRTSSPMHASRPHVMRRDEIRDYVAEYRHSASRARQAGLDGIELHLNHDDMLEWFLSPYTNRRDDEYGGPLENRARFAGAGADIVAVATGATPHRPEAEGADTACDVRDILTGAVTPGHRVLIVAQDDHLPPLSLADHLTERGHQVTLVYAAAQPGALLGRYILGGILARLHKRGVAFRQLEEVIAVHADGVRVRNVYSLATEDLHGFDTVALACGGDSDAGLYDELRGRLPEVHLLGDAYAPRRLVSATRQAYALARLLVD
jgi:hypothetical protein